MKRALYLVSDHRTALAIWRSLDLSGASVLHVDDHDDLRGLLIDVGNGRAAVTCSRLRRGLVDGGNFLARAACEGRVRSIRWVIGRYGGRDRDAGTVRYLTDASALPVRLGLARPAWFDLDYAAMREEAWDGRLEEGELLDLDWDFFAPRAAPRAAIAARARRFLALSFTTVPPVTTLAYSPLYSQASEALFEELAEAIARRFDAAIERVPDPAPPPRRGGPRALHRARFAAERWLHRRGVF